MGDRYLIGATLLANSMAFSEGPADQELPAGSWARQVVASEVKTPAP
jgi:hypothetical protein